MSTLTHETGSRIGYRFRTYVTKQDTRKRISIWLGNISQRDAIVFRRHADAIIEANTAALPIPRVTRLWLESLPKSDRAKLQPLISVSLSTREWADRYLETTAQNRTESTIATVSDSLDLFCNSFATRRIEGITSECMTIWAMEISKGRQKSTQAKILGHVRQFFRWLAADPQRAIDQVPEIAGTGGASAVGAKQFVDSSLIDRVLATVDDPELRCVISLARWAGIRVPSEIRSMRIWDIDFENRRLFIRDTKRNTERLLPLFPELGDHLSNSVNAMRSNSSDLLLPSLASVSGSTLSSRFEKILTNAGITPWPRLWHSLRATRETELAERFGLKAASLWIGNSESVAVTNYLLVPESVYESAVR